MERDCEAISLCLFNKSDVVDVIGRYLRALWRLLYPDVCVGCGEMLVEGEEVFCLSCYYGLTRTDFYKSKDNPVYARFAGKVDIDGAVSCFYYVKGGGVQRAIHKFKYGGRTNIGRILGCDLGAMVMKADFMNGIDLIVPVPLHTKKLRKRGYNQSLIIAKAVGEVLGCEVRDDVVVREVNTVSQTNFRTIFGRWDNVENSFKVVDQEPLRGKRVLLIDDVITTGATTESCVRALSEVDGIRVSVASLAVTKW